MECQCNRIFNNSLDLAKNINLNKLFMITNSYKNSIFSYETALRLNNFPVKSNQMIHLTLCGKLKEGANLIFNYLNMVDINYCIAEYFRLGLIVLENFHSKLCYYDVERSICDILVRDNFDIATTVVLTNSYKKYQFKNYEKLMLYAKNFDIYYKMERLFNW